MSKAVVKKNKKPVFALESPFVAPKWSSPAVLLRLPPIDKLTIAPRPDIDPPDHNLIVDLLCRLLTPIGAHKSAHVQPSKGKKVQRNRKRKRPVDDDDEQQQRFKQTEAPPAPCPAPPEISKHLTLGFNSTNRALDSLASASRPSSTTPSSLPDAGSPFSAIFILAPQPQLHSHLPLLAQTASLANPSDPPTRLVPLARSAEPKLAAALAIPRLGLLGVRQGAPGADALVELVREKVPVMAVDLAAMQSGAWQGARIEQVQRLESGR